MGLHTVKLLRPCWDVAFGCALIGGTPLVFMFLFGYLSFFAMQHINLSAEANETATIATSLMLGTGQLATYAASIWFRSTRRTTGRWLLGVEILIGSVCAVLYFGFFGVVTYSGMEGS